MNKIKAIAAAVALVAATGANAGFNFNDAPGGNADLLLGLISADGAKSAIFDLGAMGEFANFSSAAAMTSTSWNLTGSAPWAAALADFGSLAGAKWAVIAGDVDNSITGSAKHRYWSTTNATEATIELLTNTKIAGFNAVSGGINGALIKDGHTNYENGASVAVKGDVDHLPDAFFGGDIDWKQANFDAFATVGTSQSFFYMTGKLGNGSAKILADQYKGLDGSAAAFSLNENGTLIYAAVPEADTYAMLLAGLGMIGLMARRRRVI